MRRLAVLAALVAITTGCAAAVLVERGDDQAPLPRPVLLEEETPSRVLPAGPTPPASTAPPGTAVTSTSLAAATPTTVPWSTARLDEMAQPERSVPVTLAIPALEVAAPVVPKGVNGTTSEMEVPDNVSEVAWYRHGPAPGEMGSSVLAAHVDMAGSGPGVFFDLDRLRAGDEVVVGFLTGPERVFVVSDHRRIPKEDLDVDTLFTDEGRPVLHLITCGGGFNHTSRSYADNVVVTLLPAGSQL